MAAASLALSLASGQVQSDIGNGKANNQRIRSGIDVPLILAAAGSERAAATKAEPARDAPTRARLAIGTFGFGSEEENGRVADLVISKLTDVRGLELVDRGSIDKVLQELELPRAGIYRAKDAVRVGRLLRVDRFLLGTSISISNRTKAVVARLVDAHTGVMRDIGVFEDDGNPRALASRVASFVLDSQHSNTNRVGRIFLAVGSFEDLSLNNRQEGFMPELHGFLTTAYAGTQVQLLEREYVNSLLNEVQLDLAGLIEQPDAPAQPMQTAFWVIDGFYQSLETTSLKIEVELNVRRVFGASKHLLLNADSREKLFKDIKSAIDTNIAQSGPILAPTRNSELQLQLQAGRELSKFDPWMLVWQAPTFEELNAAQLARRKRNLAEAIRAFETVLLFEPTNREAKLYLGTLVRRYPLLHQEEGREYYRQILEDRTDDRWGKQAQTSLMFSFSSVSPAERGRWYRDAVARSRRPESAALFLKKAEEAGTEVTVGKQTGSSTEAAEDRLLSELDKWAGEMRGPAKYPIDVHPPFFQFATSVGTNRAAARLLDLLPKFKERYADLEPYLLTGVLAYQVSTNSPVVEGFEKSFDRIVLDPGKVLRPKMYFEDANSLAMEWCGRNKVFALLIKIVRGTEQAASLGFAAPLNDQQRLSLGWACGKTGNWQEALKIFQSYNNRPIRIIGAWWGGTDLVLPGKYAAECREHLGLPKVADRREFETGKSVLCLHDPAGYSRFADRDWVIAPDGSGLWIGSQNQLFHVTFDLQTNFLLTLPAESCSAISCLCPSETNLWIGTTDSGVLQWDPITKQFRRYTETEGLLMNSVRALALSQGTLWIGYGQPMGAGGLGQLELRTGKSKSYSPSLGVRNQSAPEFPYGREAPDQPPRQKVDALLPLPNGELWVNTPSARRPTLRCFRARDEVWEGAEAVQGCSCLAANKAFIFAGESPGFVPVPPGYGLGVRFKALGSKEWRAIPSATNLPPAQVTAVSVSGDDLWIGGLGYLARYDIPTETLRAFAYIQAEKVEGLGVAGGALWAQFEHHLYLVPLSKIP